MDEKKNVIPEEETPDINWDLEMLSQTENSDSRQRFQFNPDFSENTQNPFLDTPLLEIPEEPAAAPAPKKHSVVSIIFGILFYFVLAVCILVSVLNTNRKVIKLDGQLEAFELSQPSYFAQKLFEQYFGSPDWGALYDMAAPEIQSQYEGKEAYVRYIRAKVGQEPLSYQYHKTISDTQIEYGVYLNKEPIAEFTMENDSEDLLNPDWRLEAVELFYTNDEAYQIDYAIGHVVKVNGAALDDSTIVKSTQMQPTSALKMLASQIPAKGVNTHEIQGLMSQPVVTIEDAAGNALEVTYDPETRVFSEVFGEEAIPQEIRDRALEAMKTYCRFMIQQANIMDVAGYFQIETPTYKSITESRQDRLQKPQSFAFSQEEVTDLTFYQENFYSVNVALTMALTREDGSLKQDRVEKTLVFEKKQDGSWICTNMTGEKLFDEVTSVRVKFVQDDKVLFSRLINQKDEFLYCPDAETPTELPDSTPAHILKKQEDSMLEKISFAGWGLKLKDENGKPYYQPVFQVGVDRKAKIPGGLLEEPITLYPIFVWEKLK